MKYYKDLAEKEVFDSEFIMELTKSRSSAFDIIRNYRNRGYIQKIKHNLYATISLENGGLIPSKYKIACAINPTAFLSHHSAFEFYGLYNQVFHIVNVSSLNRFIPFEFGGVEYQYLRTGNQEQVDVVRGVKITSIERTIIDSINDVDKIAGPEELLKCIQLVPLIDEEKLLAYLSRLSSKLLYKKVGFLLSGFQKELRLSDGFFDICLQRGGNVIGYFSQIDKDRLAYISKWGLYAFDDLAKLIGKRGNLDV